MGNHFGARFEPEVEPDPEPAGAEGEQEPVTITVGFPYSTYQRNRDLAVDFLSEAHNIQHDAATYGGGGRKNEYVSVERVDVLPNSIDVTPYLDLEARRARDR